MIKDVMPKDKVMFERGTSYEGMRGTVLSVVGNIARVRMAGRQDCVAGEIVWADLEDIRVYFRDAIEHERTVSGE